MKIMETALRKKLFGDFDFGNSGFNEADVRSVIIDPILKELGWPSQDVLRNKTLEGEVRSGSKKQKTHLTPDYLLRIADRYACVLEAKAPAQNIVSGGNVEQAYSYAAHFLVHSNYFALCNGVEFSLFRTFEYERPALYFRIDEIDEHWVDLCRLLSPDSFQTGKTYEYEKFIAARNTKDFDYENRPFLNEIPVRKQRAKRHFGVHGYFTRQAWNVVAEYIKNYSAKGDVVLDSFGGSGITAVEALVHRRRAINVDLNPMANFIVRSLLLPVNFSQLSECYNTVRRLYLKYSPKTNEDIEKILEKYPGPKDLPLPKGSDVETVTQLFTRKQLAQLALLKGLIKHVAKRKVDKNIQDTLMLMFSGLVTKINLTYHQSSGRSEGRGNASPFQYYRYRLAPNPVFVDVIKYFNSRYSKVFAAKKEIEKECLLNQKTVEEMFADAQIIKGSATDLSFLGKESVDYIYTDPPYGKKIPYLDLSVMWNAWLDLDVSESDYELEAIEGGEHNKTKKDYNELISKSIQEMYRVLKFDRWLSFVFAHKDPEFWHLIIDTCERCGFEYIGAVPQKNGQQSFKKKQHPFTVLSGELIISFRKARNPRAVVLANLGMDIGEIVLQTVEGIIAKNDGATIEQINDELIIRGLEMGFLDLLAKEYSDLSGILSEFDYDKEKQIFKIKDNSHFKTKVDVKLRIRYYLLALFRRMERQNKNPSINEIIFHIMPLLKNGITPEHQTIMSVLEDVAERVSEDEWRLKPKENTLF